MLIAGIVTLTPKAYADTTCQPIYGGGQTCTSTSISIEKDVVNPVTNNDVHDLGINDPNFHPGDTVTFHITIQNTGTNNISSLTVKDIFPSVLQFVNGPGSFDNSSQTLTFQVGGLATNQSQTFTVMGTVRNPLPNNQSTCTVNQAIVTTNTNASAQDSSQFCVQAVSAGISPTLTPFATPQVISTPATGASPMWLLLIPLSIGGYFLQKQTKRRIL